MKDKKSLYRRLLVNKDDEAGRLGIYAAKASRDDDATATEEGPGKLWSSEWICNKFYICLSQYFPFRRTEGWSSYINLNVIFLHFQRN